MGDKTRPEQMEVATVVDVSATNLNVPTTLATWNALQIRRVTGTPNYLIPQTAADDIGATGARITKGWFTDLDIEDGLRVGDITVNIGGSLITTTSGDLNIDAVTSNIHMPNLFVNRVQFVTGGLSVNEIVTSISGASTDDQIPTGAAVWAAIGDENTWDRDTVGTPFLKPANLGDDIGDTLIRINKIWATDIESTNYPSVGGTPLSDQYLATSNDVRFGQVIVDNLTLNGSTLSSSTGNNINITPDNPADHIIINSHWDFDGKTLVAISDSDTTLTAYTGKNITIESVTFDGGVVAAVTDLTVDNLNLDGNTLITTSGNMLLTSAAHITLTTPENNSIYLTPSGTFGMVRINSLTLSGDTISSDFSNDLNLISEAAIVLTSADNNDITLTAGLNGKVAIDNVRIYSSTIETSGGDLRLISASNTLLIGNSAAGVDYRLGFDGENNNGYIRWWEDEAYFDFDHYIAQPGVFASIYVTGGSAAQEIATGASYVKTTAFTTNGENSNCTSDQTNNKITITKTGKYRVVGRCCALSEFANVVWEGVAFLDGVAKTNLHFKQKLTTNTDVNNMGFNDLIDVPSVPVDLDLRVRHDSGGGVEITMEYATLNVEYVGST